MLRWLTDTAAADYIHQTSQWIPERIGVSVCPREETAR